MKIFLGADHRGFELKEKLKEWLKDHGHAVEDCGAHALDPADDYVDFAAAVAKEMAVATASEARGILICGSGHGMDVVANKFKGVSAALATDVASAIQERQHDDNRVIVLASDSLIPPAALDIVKAWLDTPFSGEERHVRRLEKIEEIEEKNFSAEGGSASGGK